MQKEPHDSNPLRYFGRDGFDVILRNTVAVVAHARHSMLRCCDVEAFPPTRRVQITLVETKLVVLYFCR